MHLITRQLEQVRRTARWMLIGQRLCQWLAGMIALAIALALIDYALRLPGPMRLALGLTALVLAAAWLATRLRLALGFWPGLDQLALRLERLYPQLTGSLAAAVEFTIRGENFRSPALTAALAHASINHVRGQLDGVEPRRLLDPTRSARAAGALALALIVLAVFITVAPASSAIAAKRWLTPLSGVEWPRWASVVAVDQPHIHPAQAPLRLAADVTRGYSRGMRVSVHYRITDAQGQTSPWRSLLMTEQARTPSLSESIGGASEGAGKDRGKTFFKVHRFERPINLPPALVHALQVTGQTAGVEYYFTAGDDRTAPRTAVVAARPAVVRVEARITPPTYAAGVVEPRTAELREQGGAGGQGDQVASALTGSTITLHVFTNKPPASTLRLADAFPGLPDLEKPRAKARGMNGEAPDRSGASPANSHDPGLSTTFTLTQSVKTPIRLVDRFGLRNLSDRLYDIDAVADKPPAVSMTAPSTDLSVLPSATIPLKALARDDVAVQSLTIRTRVQRKATSPTHAAPEESATKGLVSPAKDHPGTTLAQRTGRQLELTLDHTLDLAAAFPGKAALKPGDVVILWAQAQDGFELDGRQHDPVRSAPRRLRIITAADLVSQLRNDLAGMHEQVTRLARTQQTLLDANTPQAAADQSRISGRIASQQALLESLQQRADRNHLDAPPLTDLMSKAHKLLDQARQASTAAQKRLKQAADAHASDDKARASQTQTRDTLNQLASLLDQGQDALALENQLEQMRARQDELAQAARKLFPQTVGRDAASLPVKLRDALKDVAQRQKALSDEAQAMIRKMRQTSQNLAQQKDARAQAAAQALAQAASVAQRQGLDQSMRQSSSSIAQNQLAQAGRQQGQSMDTLNQMLDQVESQQKKLIAILQRRLEKLAQALERLIARQKHEVAALGHAADAALPSLEPPQSALRRSTMAVQASAQRASESAPVAGLVGQAVDAQGQAILSLRQSARPDAKQAQVKAVDTLEKALAKVKALKHKTQLEQARKQREQLRIAYTKLAQQQQQLHDQTQPLATRGDLTRKQRASLMDLGAREEQLRAAAAKLGQRVDQTLVFKALHQQVDKSAGQAANLLRQARATAPVLDDQAHVVWALKAMASALKEDKKAAPFAGPTGGGGGGGGGGAGQKPQAVPPIAQLKLLRAMQASIYDQTRQWGGRPDATDQLEQLSARQHEVAQLGQSLMEQLKQAAAAQTAQPHQQE